MAKKQWAEPDPDWLLLRRAPFALLARNNESSSFDQQESVSPCPEDDELDPDHLARRSEQISQQILEEQGNGDQPSLDELEQLLAEKSGADSAEIKIETGSFWFWFGGSLILGEPWALVDSPRLSVDPRREAEALFDKNSVTVDDQDAARERRRYEAVQKATGLVWRRHMLSAFDYAIASGNTLRLYARPESLTAPFQELPADGWPCMEVIDWQSAFAVAQDGTPYFSIHVDIIGQPASTSERLRPAPKSEIDKAITEAYDLAESEGKKPPNIRELPIEVEPILEQRGFRTSRNRISDVGKEPQHASRRRRRGKTVLSEKTRR